MPIFRPALVLSLILGAASLHAAAEEVTVTLSWPTLVGTSGYLAFDLVSGSGGVTNTVTIDQFFTASLLGTASAAGDVSGDLGHLPVVIASTTFFSEFLQPITYATGTTTFRFDTTSNAIGAQIPDAFSLFVLDTNFNPISTSDPTGADALLAVDLAPGSAPETFTSDVAIAISSSSSPVPEPSTAWMVAIGLLAPIARAWTRRRAAGRPSASSSSFQTWESRS